LTANQADQPEAARLSQERLRLAGDSAVRFQNRVQVAQTEHRASRSHPTQITRSGLTTTATPATQSADHADGGYHLKRSPNSNRL
jgi:hypothetical protein